MQQPRRLGHSPGGDPADYVALSLPAPRRGDIAGDRSTAAAVSRSVSRERQPRSITATLAATTSFDDRTSVGLARPDRRATKARRLPALDEQKRVFRTVLERCAESGDKVLTVHSIRSASAVLDMIEAHLPRGRGKVVMHWFTGGRAEALRAAALGCYFSINAEMALGERGRALIAELPIERLLTETDGPFTQTQGRPTRPSDVYLALEAIGRIRKMSVEVLGDSVRNNLKALLAPA